MFGTMSVTATEPWDKFTMMVQPGYHSMPAFSPKWGSVSFMFGDIISSDDDEILVEAYFPENAFNTPDTVSQISTGDEFTLTDGMQYRGKGYIVTIDEKSWTDSKMSRMGKKARGE